MDCGSRQDTAGVPGQLQIEDCLDADGGVAMPPGVTLISLIDRNIANVGDAVAYRYLDYSRASDGQVAEVTWTQFGSRLRAIGARVQQAAGRGERVAVLAPQGIDYVAGFYGAVKAGTNIDVGSSVRPLSEKQRALLQEIADEFYRRFRTVVSERRPKTCQAPKYIFDVRVFTTSKALEYGLVNEVVPSDELVARGFAIADHIMTQPRTIRRYADVGMPARGLQPVDPRGDVLHPGCTQQRAPPEPDVSLRNHVRRSGKGRDDRGAVHHAAEDPALDSDRRQQVAIAGAEALDRRHP